MYNPKYDANLFQLPYSVRAHNEGSDMRQYHTSLGVASNIKNNNTNNEWRAVDYLLICSLSIAAIITAIHFLRKERIEDKLRKRRRQ